MILTQEGKGFVVMFSNLCIKTKPLANYINVFYTEYIHVYQLQYIQQYINIFIFSLIA